MSNKYTSVYDWLKYIKANVVGINLRELRIIVLLIMEKKPAKLFKHLAQRDFAIKENEKGIYQIHGLHFFTVQVIIFDELNENEYLWLKSLIGTMESENAEKLILIIED